MSSLHYTMNAKTDTNEKKTDTNPRVEVDYRFRKPKELKTYTNLSKFIRIELEFFRYMNYQIRIEPRDILNYQKIYSKSQLKLKIDSGNFEKTWRKTKLDLTSFPELKKFLDNICGNMFELITQICDFDLRIRFSLIISQSINDINPKKNYEEIVQELVSKTMEEHLYNLQIQKENKINNTETEKNIINKKNQLKALKQKTLIYGIDIKKDNSE